MKLTDMDLEHSPKEISTKSIVLDSGDSKKGVMRPPTHPLGFQKGIAMAPYNFLDRDSKEFMRPCQPSLLSNVEPCKFYVVSPSPGKNIRNETKNPTS